MATAKTVLIVDDDGGLVQELKIFLEGQGFSVQHAPDGETALRLMEKTIPDVVLLDIIMPQVDGFTVAKKIRYNEKTRKVPIIVFSAQEGMRELFAIEGIRDYMVKPVDRESLLKLITQRTGMRA